LDGNVLTEKHEEHGDQQTRLETQITFQMQQKDEKNRLGNWKESEAAIL